MSETRAQKTKTRKRDEKKEEERKKRGKIERASERERERERERKRKREASTFQPWLLLSAPVHCWCVKCKSSLDDLAAVRILSAVLSQIPLFLPAHMEATRSACLVLYTSGSSLSLRSANSSSRSCMDFLFPREAGRGESRGGRDCSFCCCCPCCRARCCCLMFSGISGRVSGSNFRESTVSGLRCFLKAPEKKKAAWVLIFLTTFFCF